MPSFDRPAAASRRGTHAKRFGARASRCRHRTIAALGALGAVLALGGIVIASAVATPGCASSQHTSPDGTIVYGSACADRIVVTSPLVKKVYAGKGDDVIYANPNVEQIYGGEGNDVIYGDLPEGEAGTGVNYESETGVNYETGPEGEASASRSKRHRATGARATASNRVECSGGPCYGGDGNQEMFGGPGADIMFGQRGNDILYGGGGGDALYGGIGDDTIYGNDGPDLLSGGPGTDTLDGNNGSDLVRGDGTVDIIKDTGSSHDTDTLSFATAVTPGFRGSVPIPGFPRQGDGEERGVYVRLDGKPAPCGVQACNNDARYGGGGDKIEASGFENVIGSPFSDYIVGSAGDNRIDGGGGADVIEGGGGNDRLFGGAGDDYLVGGPGEDTTFFGEEGPNNCAPDVEIRYGCTSSAAEVHQRDHSKIEVGFMSPPVGGLNWEDLYLVGSEGSDLVNVKSAFQGLSGYAVFTTEPGSAPFDTSPGASSPNCSYTPSEVKCTLLQHLDAINLAGMAGDDMLSIAGNGTEWETTTSPILLGGEGNDTLYGSNQTEDMLVDGNGPGNDTLYGFGLDDALLNNEGTDNLQAGAGSDLLLSATTCDGDLLQGAEGKAGDGTDSNNASWSQLPPYSGGVVADLESGTAGGQFTEVIVSSAPQQGGPPHGEANPGQGEGAHGSVPGHTGSGPSCAAGTLDQLRNINDLEGSAQADALYGDAHANNLLGRKGEDRLFGRGGPDRIAAKDGEPDEIGGGGGKDVCIYDEGLDAVTGCSP